MFLALVDATDAQLVGGKAAALGGMLRAGFSVPDGIVLPTSHFEDFLNASGRRESIESLCESVDVESPEATREVSSTIVSWLQDTPLSDALATALTSHFRRQNAGSLAVRSSAVGEDSARASFAGQLDSFLDITDEAALLASVKRCWCSYYSARGLAYQRATGVGLKSMAVIVQTQIARCMGTSGTARYTYLLGEVERWSAVEKAMPQTLIHNDFSPRNIAIRPDGRLCAYDWELARVGLPQRDLAEFLCFTLPPDVTEDTLTHWVEFHRDVLERGTGKTIDKAAWRLGFGAAMADFLVTRLPLYAMISRFHPQPFLDRVVKTWVRIDQHMGFDRGLQ